MDEGTLILVAIGAPLVASLFCTVVTPKKAWLLFTGALAVDCLAIVFLAIQLLDRGTIVLEHSWIEPLGSYLALRADSLALVFSSITSLVALAAAIYMGGYMDIEGAGRAFSGWHALFVASMMGVLFAQDMILFYVFWELMLIPSTALLVHWGQGKNPFRTGLRYFIITHIGAVMMLCGIVWVIVITGTSDMVRAAGLLAGIDARQTGIMGFLFVAGFAVKMAVVPGHVWLPDAHSEAQLPTSILLSATMMNMGIYGMVRFLGEVLPETVLGAWTFPLAVLGLVNQWYGGIQALRQRELKRVAAYSTVSQMGYVLLGISAGTAWGMKGALMHAVAHSVGKALFFMAIGAVIHLTGAHALGEVEGLGGRMPVTMLCAVVAALTLCGAPPFAAFQSEWQVFSAVLQRMGVVPVLLGIGASVLTAVYALGLVWRVFYGSSIGVSSCDASVTGTKEGGLKMLIPMVSLVALSLMIGTLPWTVTSWFSKAAEVIVR